MKQKEKDKESIMRAHIDARKSGEQTVIAYCKAHGLAVANYYYWQKRLQPSTAEPSFIQLQPSASNASITITFPNGVTMMFSGNVSSSTLKELACCI